MKITLSPIRRDLPLDLHRRGDMLSINGIEHDFSTLPEGGTLPLGALDGDWFAGDATRRDGIVHLVLALPHGARAPVETLFPAPLVLEDDGPVALPPHSLGDDAPEDG
ncbi:MAG: hypothetical protein ACK4GW_10610 [Pseudorhodobacter sp.]